MLHKKSTAQWLEIGDKKIYFRSLWEANYGRYLEYLKFNGHIYDWEHEPKTFWFLEIKRGVRSYLPDFRIWPTANESDCHWIEVKGYYDNRSKTKIKRFNKYYPKEKLFLIDSKWFSDNSKKLKLVVPGWEISSNNLKKGLKNEQHNYMQF